MQIGSAKKNLLIFSLLSLNIVEQAASVISGTIPGMAKSFPAQSEVNIEMLTTIVSIFVTIFVLVSGFIVKKIGQKQTAIIGLTIATVSSVIPFFSNSFILIMISRALLGVGIGLANPLAISLIGAFFKGEERAKIMGYRTAAAGVGTAVMTYIAGQLLTFGWHSAYLVYLLFIPTLILFILFVPSPEKYAIDKKETDHSDKKDSLNTEQPNYKDPKMTIFGLTILIFLVLTAMMIVMVKLALLYVGKGIGTATQASTALSILSFAQVLGGIMFGKAYLSLKKNVLSISLLLAGLSLVSIGFVTSRIILIALMILIGIAGGLIIPYIFNRITEISLPKNAPLNTSIALVGSNFGAFISPYAASLIGKTSADSIINAGGLLLILAVITLAMNFKILFHHSSQKIS